MREPGVRTTVLIVHEDLGFVCWMGELLTRAGYQTLPALNSRDAVRLSTEFSLPIDVAIIDPALQNITKAVETMRRRFPSLKTVAIRTPGQDPMAAIDAEATLARPAGTATLSQQECLRSVRRALKSARTAA